MTNTTVYLFLIFLGLSYVFWVLYNKLSKLNSSLTTKLDQINELKKEVNSFKKQNEILNSHYEKEVENNALLKKKIDQDYEFYKNQGEFKTNNDLLKIKNRLEKSDNFSNIEFHIFNNVMFTGKNENFIRQIDHLVLCSKGLYILETKYWKGQIFHQVKMDDLEANIRWLYPIKSEDKSITFCIQNSMSEDNFFSTILPKSSPINQAKASARSLYQVLKDYNLPSKFIKALVYYNYPQDDFYNKVIDPHNNLNNLTRNCEGFTNNQNLINYFINEMKREDVLSHQELTELKHFFETKEKFIM